MITFKVGNAVNALEFPGKWEPHCHWIVQPDEPLEATFVQALLDKYGHQIEAYSFQPFMGGSYRIELQFRSPDVAEECNGEYLDGWRKGGQVALAKKAANKSATKRLLKNRMYILPDGAEFIYYAKWDHHGNVVGKVMSEGSHLANRIEHRSVLENSLLVPRGREPWWMNDEPSDAERQAILDTICRLRAKHSHYGPGDCYYGEPIENVFRELKEFSTGKILAVLNDETNGLLEMGEGSDITDHDIFVWINNAGWRKWSQWDDKFFLDIVDWESGQDWPGWDDQEYWKTISPEVWQQINSQHDQLEKE